MKKLAVVYFPNINLDKFNKFRQKYDPNWKIIKPHITIIFPLPNIPKRLLLSHLNTITKGVKSFPINLNGLTKSFDNYLFLQVKVGNDEVVTLHDKLYSRILSPYFRSDIPYIPHITLGYFGKENNSLDSELYKQAYEEAQKISLNLLCKFDQITLIEGDGITPAKTIRTFKLRL